MAETPSGGPREVAEELGLTIVSEEGSARFGATLLLACWEPDLRVVRLWERGIAEEAARRGEPVEQVRLEALAHEVLHALGAGGSESEIRRRAREWACTGRARGCGEEPEERGTSRAFRE